MQRSISELRKERQKMQALNLERTRYDREESRHSLYYEYVGSVIDTLPLPDFMPVFENNEKQDEIRYLVCLADIHYGAVFRSMNNDYSPAIFRDKLEYLASKLYDFISAKKLNRIHILELGDTIQGILRINDLRMNESSIVKSVVDVSRYLAQFLNELSKFTEIEYYHVGTSNHSQLRPLGTKANQLGDEDMEYIIGHYISDLLKDNHRVHVHLTDNGDPFIDINGLGYNVIAAHGHQFNNLENAVRDLSMIKNEIVDYLVVGHFHGAKNIEISEGVTYSTELLCCPSFVGSDPYSDSIMKGSKPAVSIFGFDQTYGHTETYKILL